MQDVERRPDHHIWCNNGTWFVHLTVLWKQCRKIRVRKSLRTRNVAEARRRRDRFIARLYDEPDLTLLGVAPGRTAGRPAEPRARRGMS